MPAVMTIIGTRPHFMKACAVSSLLANTNAVTEVLVHTGQHYDANMSDVFFQELFPRAPDIKLDIGSGLHGWQTGSMLVEIEKAMLAHKPDCVLVYGDTNSTLAGALAAAKLNIALAHVESGLRSFNREMPEEINRIIADHIANKLYTPTSVATQNLKLEGINENQILQTGDLMYDVAMQYADYAVQHSSIIQDLALAEDEFILVTFHRPYNLDSQTKMTAIVDALNELATQQHLVFPVHPRTRQALEKYQLIVKMSSQIKIIDPVGYIDMVRLEKAAKLIITDSGGVQKEAYFHQKPCVTLRPETEWVELVTSGWNRLVDPDDPAKIVQAVQEMLNKSYGDIEPLYGEGHAAQLIVKDIINNLL